MWPFLPSLWLSSSLAHASIVVAAAEADLVAQSRAIVMGTVITLQNIVTPQGWALTRAHVQVSDGVLGANTGDTVAIDVPGGALPHGLRMSVSGAPELQLGQLIVGFLEPSPLSPASSGASAGRDAAATSASAIPVFRPLGLANGILYVVMDAQGQLIAQRDLSGVMMMNARGDDTARDVAEQAQMPEPLEQVLARIRAQLRQANRIPAPSSGDGQ